MFPSLRPAVFPLLAALLFCLRVLADAVGLKYCRSVDAHDSGAGGCRCRGFEEVLQLHLWTRMTVGVPSVHVLADFALGVRPFNSSLQSCSEFAVFGKEGML